MVRYAILGPVELRDGQRQVAVDGRRQLALLAYLLLHANRVVSSDRLIDVVWGHAPSDGARKRLHMAVARLRNTLSIDGSELRPALRTLAGGYVLDVRAGELDADVFATRVDDARAALAAGHAEQASDELREALALWRGPALAQLTYADFAQADIRRLEELRLTALHTRIDADLQLGRHEALTAELEALVARHPTLERFVEQLMCVLYRCGRQADALAAYQRARTHLAAELGLEPGPALRAIQAQILEQAPALDAAVMSARDPPGAPIDSLATPTGSTARAGVLPVYPTSLIGRDGDLGRLVSLISQRHLRLLTLTGPGGIGKTRLALELAHTLRSGFADGARFMSLVAIADADLVFAALVQQLGHAPLPGELPVQAGIRLLRSHEVLLVLDNFEHVLGAAADVAQLLADCPDLVMVITSREALRISAEHVYEVAPLTLPPSGGHLNVSALERSAAVSLFIDRAAAGNPTYSLTAGNRHAVREICVQLDGLPLAIELAAARTALLEPSELLRRLGDRLSLLSSGPRDAEPRHRTLRATIDWSYDLLDEDERAAFCALAIFEGGATLSAAEAVTGATLDTIESLVAKSLVMRCRTPDGEVRLSLLGTIREYALERLKSCGCADVLRRRHRDYYLGLAQTGARELWGSRQLRWLRRFDDEYDNFRAAVQWSLTANDAANGLRLASALMEQWGQRRRPREVSSWIRRALDATGVCDDGLRARALAGLALASRDDRAMQSAYAHEGLELALAADDARAACRCWCHEILNLTGTPDEIKQPDLAARALSLARASEDAPALLIALETNVIAARTFSEARPYFEEAAALLHEMGDRLVTCVLLHNIGWRALDAGDERFAAEALDDSIALAREIDDLTHLPFTLAGRGLLWMLQGDVPAARAAFREALQRSRDLGLTPPAWEALMGLGAIAARGAHFEDAALLCGASRSIRGDEPLSPVEQRLHDRHIAPLRSAGDAHRWTAAWRRGAALGYEQAVAAGLGDRLRARHDTLVELRGATVARSA